MGRRVLLTLASCFVFAANGLSEPPKAGLPDGAVARLGNARLRHADRPTCVAFSPDSKLVVTGGLDGALRLWNVATGDRIAGLAPGPAAILGIHFTHDAKRIVVLYSDGFVFYQAQTLQELDKLESPKVSHFEVSSDGSLIAFVVPVIGIQVHELKTGLAKLELPDGPLVAFHPDGKSVAAADPEGRVTIYRTVGGKPGVSVNHGWPVNGLAFRPDGKAFATAGRVPKPMVKIWETRQDAPAVTLDATGPIAFLGNDRIAAVRKGGVGIYDFSKKEWVKEIPEASGAYAVSPDGKTLAALGNSGLRVRLWDLATGEQLHAKGDAFAEVALMAPSADDSSMFFVAGAKASTWKIGAAAPAAAGGFPSAVHVAAAGGGRLIAATEPGIAIWDGFEPMKPLAAKPSRTIALPDITITALAISSDGKRGLCAGSDRKVRLFDPVPGQVLRTIPVLSSVLEVAFVPNSDRVLIYRNSYLCSWKFGEAKGHEELWKYRIAGALRGTLAVSPDGKTIAFSSIGAMFVLDAATGAWQFNIERSVLDEPFTAVAFSTDSRMLFTGSGGTSGAVQVWDLETQKEVKQFSTGLGGITKLAVFAGGTKLASTGTDEAITVWSLK